MKQIITKFNDETGDFDIVTPVPFTLNDGIEVLGMMVANIPKYEDTETYNVFDLIRENQELKEQIEYLKGGEYLNQLRFERNMLQDVVDKMEVLKEDKMFIDMTRRNTELLEENRKYKEVIDEVIEYISELDDNKDDTTCYDIDKNTRDYILSILKEVE